MPTRTIAARLPAPFLPSCVGVIGAGLVLCKRACPPSEHRTGGQTATARIVSTEEAAEHLAAYEQAGDRPSCGVEDPTVDIGVQTSEREGDSAGDGEG
jgi:hypothetical protein